MSWVEYFPEGIRRTTSKPLATALPSTLPADSLGEDYSGVNREGMANKRGLNRGAFDPRLGREDQARGSRCVFWVQFARIAGNVHVDSRGRPRGFYKRSR